ncbi:MAG: SPOR domain-containing protein [Pseudomonadota bacterium]
MASHERRVYEPSDEVRVFDGSEEDDDVEGSRLPLLIVLALLVLAMFAGVVWLAYTQGVARGRGETPILTAANGPEKVAPQQAGGTNVPYQGFKIYEQPAPPDDASDPQPVDAAKPAPVAATPAPVAEAPNPAPVTAAPKPAPAAATPPPAAAPKPVASVAAPKPAAALPKPAAAPPKTVASLIQQSQTTPPATRPAITAPAGPATGAPRALTAATAPATPAPAAPVAATPAAAPSGAYVLQIGAFKTQAEADSAWRAYRGKHAALLTGYSPDVRQVELGEKGTWYRLRIAGFNDREVASALCDRLKADGGGCFLGR